jgi:hypothetical protein
MHFFPLVPAVLPNIRNLHLSSVLIITGNTTHTLSGETVGIVMDE